MTEKKVVKSRSQEILEDMDREERVAKYGEKAVIKEEEKEKCPKCKSEDILLDFVFAPSECKSCGHKW